MILYVIALEILYKLQKTASKNSQIKPSYEFLKIEKTPHFGHFYVFRLFFAIFKNS